VGAMLKKKNVQQNKNTGEGTTLMKMKPLHKIGNGSRRKLLGKQKHYQRKCF